MNSNKKGWTVVIAGTGINLAFGVLYAWSIFSKTLSDAQGWSKSQASYPYMVAIIMFAAVMIPAGKIQDRIGPRKVATLGGILIGLGLILAGFLPSIPGLVFSFGILAGSGIGLGYAATTPAAVKWFPPEKKGLITGIVVGGFGLASIYIAPLTNYLIGAYGVFNSFRIFGIAFLIFTIPLAQLVNNPEKPLNSSAATKKVVADLTWREMIRTKQFVQLWFMFFAGALGGLMIIGHLSKIASIQLGGNVGFILVALAAIANASGRPAAGIISDKLGRGKTMMVLYILQGTTLLFFTHYTNFVTLLLGAAVVYFAYGAMLSVYPSACGDFYGTKNLGLNYGILFSAWGAGGTIGPLMGGLIADKTGSYGPAFMVAAATLYVAAVVSFVIKPYVHSEKSLIQTPISAVEVSLKG